MTEDAEVVGPKDERIRKIVAQLRDLYPQMSFDHAVLAAANGWEKGIGDEAWLAAAKAAIADFPEQYGLT